MPALKQKTGIVKSKVPPPVPPRGSPKDRRGQQQQQQQHRGASPKGTPPSGRYNKNHLNDKYFDACGNLRRYHRQSPTIVNDDNNNNNDEDRPTFGPSRSPSCVEDWLEINNFDVLPQPEESSSVTNQNNNNPSPPPLLRPSPLNVKSTLDHIKRQLEIRRDSAANIVPCESYEITELRRSSKVTQLLSTYAEASCPIITSVVKKPAPPPPLPPPTIHADMVKNKAVLASLRPARRKKRPAPRAEDIYCNAKEKQNIMTALSCIELHSNDDTYDRVIDSFSLEGEFV